MSARAIALAALLGALVACVVHRQSEQYACTTNRDCKDMRVCTDGYCVDRLTEVCPAPCTSCDLTTMTCNVDCSAGQPCGDLQCPAGFACAVKCSAQGCGNIDCALASRCTVTCTGSSACRAIDCGRARCEVSCSGQQACSTVDCSASCACDVDCNGSASCPLQHCPAPLCSTAGAGSVCTSAPPGCDQCFSP